MRGGGGIRSAATASTGQPSPNVEANLRAERLRDQQDVGEDDGAVEIVSPNRLQGDFGGEFGRVAERKEIARLGASRPVFGQVTSSLPHQPDRRNR